MVFLILFFNILRKCRCDLVKAFKDGNININFFANFLTTERGICVAIISIIYHILKESRR